MIVAPSPDVASLGSSLGSCKFPRVSRGSSRYLSAKVGRSSCGSRVGFYTDVSLGFPADRDDLAQAVEKVDALGLVNASVNKSPKSWTFYDVGFFASRRLQKNVMFACEAFQAFLGPKGYEAVFQVLTLGGDAVWHPRLISDFLKRNFRHIRKHRKDAYCYAIWSAELQPGRLAAGEDAGKCVHYNVVTWVPKGVWLPKPDKAVVSRGERKGERWWSGHCSTGRARNAARYVAKYASKFTPDVMDAWPKGIRKFAICGGDAAFRLARRRLNLPGYARAFFGQEEDVRRWTRKDAEASDRPEVRSRRGGWISRDSDVWLPSPFEVLGVIRLPGGRVFVQVVEREL